MLIIGWLSGTIALIGFLPYIRAILRKETCPHLLTWIIWTLIGILLATSYWASGASRVNLIIPFVYVVGSLCITVIAFKYREPGYNSLDIFCFLGALFSLVLWILTNQPILALILNILVDFLGALPTIAKTYRVPTSENITGWIFFLIGNGLNLFALGTYNLAILIYPLYLFLISLLMISLILRGYRCTLQIKS